MSLKKTAAALESIAASLKTLSEPETVAAAIELMQAKKVKGVLGDTAKCLVAQYIAKTVKASGLTVEVDGTNIDLEVPDPESGISFITVHVPVGKVIGKLITEFDSTGQLVPEELSGKKKAKAVALIEKYAAITAK